MDIESEPNGVTVKTLEKVGDFKFNSKGQLESFKTKNKYVKYRTRTRGSKGPKKSALHLDSSYDPYESTIAADNARTQAENELSRIRGIVGGQAYDALCGAASGMRIAELCGGILGNKTDSKRGRGLVQFAIERIIDDRTPSKRAA